jgi:hypothetical protein
LPACSTIFAEFAHGNKGESTVKKRGTSAEKPSGMALKQMDVVEKHGLNKLAGETVHPARIPGIRGEDWGSRHNSKSCLAKQVAKS